MQSSSGSSRDGIHSDIHPNLVVHCRTDNRLCSFGIVLQNLACVPYGRANCSCPRLAGHLPSTQRLHLHRIKAPIRYRQVCLCHLRKRPLNPNIARALRDSAANNAVLSVVEGNSMSRNAVRSPTACSIVDCEKIRLELAESRIVVVSPTSPRSGGTKIGLGVGMGLKIYIRDVTSDHNE